MIRPLHLLLGLGILVAGPGQVSAQTEQTDAAVQEAVRRQHNTILLRQKLTAAQNAERQGDLGVAVKLYEDGLRLVEGIGQNGIEEETKQVVSGLTSVRVRLAQDAQKRHDYREADVQVSRALKVDPANANALALKADNDKILASMQGMMPDQAYLDRLPEMTTNRINNSTKIQNAKLLFENGQYDEAEAILLQVMKDEPGNTTAAYYTSLIKEQLHANAVLEREITSKGNILKVERAWISPIDRHNLPVPNPMANTNLVYTSKQRQEIVVKLDRIRLDNVMYDGLPLSEVVRNLSVDVKRRDPDKKGINFIMAPNAGNTASRQNFGGQVFIDPTTGLPTQAPGAFEEQEPIDMASIAIKINPAISDVRLQDLLDILVKVAERPIAYSVEDYGIVFSVKSQDPIPLHTRTFRVDPNTFWMGLESVEGITFGDVNTSSSSGGGGGGSRGGGGGGNQGGGQNGGGDSGSTAIIPRVSVASGGGQNNQGGGRGGRGGGGGGGGGGGSSLFNAGLGVGGVGGAGGAGGLGGGGGGQGGQNGQGGGLAFITSAQGTGQVQEAVRLFFTSLGVDLSQPGKHVFFNDRQGTLFVRATLDDLDIIEKAVQVLNIQPPQVNVRAKFAEVAQNDRRALGFDWYLGNVTTDNGKVGFSGGTAPSFGGAPSAGNPNGFFPGTSAENTIPSLASDQLLSSGLRNVANAPALGTLTGILTDPQFRLVVRALEQREGVELLSAPDVTTVSGRQAQLQVVDIRTIVVANDLNQNTSGGGGDTIGGGGGGGAVGTTSGYQTQALPFGPVLDLIPYVSADGFTVQMVLIPTITEFIGYDDPGGFVPQAQSVAAGVGGVGLPITAQLPLPHFRVRQVTTTSIVWDGQTIALGGLLSESVAKTKDKVPVLGDLPFLGRFFRSEANVQEKKNLVIFVTPTIMDPAGNRVHSDADLPFRQGKIPEQRPPVEAGATAAAN